MPAERRTLRSRTSLTSHPSPPSPKVGRPRRAASRIQSQAVTVARSESRSPEDAKKSIHLTVKMPSSKLREATSGKQKNVSINSRGSFVGGEIINGPRGSRAKRSIVVESESEDDEDDEEEDEVVPSDQEMDEEEEDDDEEDEEDEAGADSADADADADGDVEMDAGTLLNSPRMLKMTGPTQKPSVVVTPAQDGKLKSVESKEMEMEDDDEELSELDSEAEAEDVEEDAEGDVDETNRDEGSRSPGTGSRASTPDISKMTKRQRSRLDQVMAESDFLQLPMGMSSYLPATLNSYQPSPPQNRKRKSISQPKNTPCAAPKWHAVARTSARSAMKRKRYASPTPHRSPPLLYPPFTNKSLQRTTPTN